MKALSLLLIGISTFSTLALAQEPADIAVTVYSTADPASFDPQQYIAQQAMGHNPNWVWQVPGFGVVKEQRSVELKAGLNELKFSDVAQFIDPSTVSFLDLSDAKTVVREQNFQFDLANAEKILSRYIDRPITVSVSRGDEVEDVTGTLISTTGGQLVLKTAQGVQLLNRNSSQVKLGDLPGGLLTKPTLLWKLHASSAGTHKIRTTYQTAGITWRADYNLIVNSKDTAADIGAWVTLMNLCGSSFPNARLKLVAGDVQRVQSQQVYAGAALRQKVSMAMDEAGLAFTEKPFFEYHLYTLPIRTDISSNSTQQIMLFPTSKDVKVEKLLVYYGLPEAAHWSFFGDPQTDRNFGNSSAKKVDVYLRFRNEAQNNMGMPLPRGKVRVYKQDEADQSLEFIGEDLIDHTARDEKVLVKLGQSFDVVGERTQTDFAIDTRARHMQESFKITLRNHKDAPQKAIIKENLYRWVQWEITSKSDAFEKVDARTIHIPVEIPAHGEKTITYSVRYSW